MKVLLKVIFKCTCRWNNFDPGDAGVHAPFEPQSHQSFPKRSWACRSAAPKGTLQVQDKMTSTFLCCIAHCIDYCSFNIYTKDNKTKQMRVTGDTNLSVKRMVTLFPYVLLMHHEKCIHVIACNSVSWSNLVLDCLWTCCFHLDSSQWPGTQWLWWWIITVCRTLGEGGSAAGAGERTPAGWFGKLNPNTSHAWPAGCPDAEGHVRKDPRCLPKWRQQCEHHKVKSIQANLQM